MTIKKNYKKLIISMAIILVGILLLIFAYTSNVNFYNDGVFNYLTNKEVAIHSRINTLIIVAGVVAFIGGIVSLVLSIMKSRNANKNIEE